MKHRTSTGQTIPSTFFNLEITLFKYYCVLFLFLPTRSISNLVCRQWFCLWSKRDRQRDAFFGQQFLNKVVGRGVKQGGKGSIGETRIEEMGWKIVHGGGDLVSPESSPF